MIGSELVWGLTDTVAPHLIGCAACRLGLRATVTYYSDVSLTQLKPNASSAHTEHTAGHPPPPQLMTSHYTQIVAQSPLQNPSGTYAERELCGEEKIQVRPGVKRLVYLSRPTPARVTRARCIFRCISRAAIVIHPRVRICIAVVDDLVVVFVLSTKRNRTIDSEFGTTDFWWSSCFFVAYRDYRTPYKTSPVPSKISHALESTLGDNLVWVTVPSNEHSLLLSSTGGRALVPSRAPRPPPLPPMLRL